MSEHIKETKRLDGDGHVGSEESMLSSWKEMEKLLEMNMQLQINEQRLLLLLVVAVLLYLTPVECLSRYEQFSFVFYNTIARVWDFVFCLHYEYLLYEEC